MKKILTVILLCTMLVPSIVIAGFKPATLYKDASRIAVTTESQAKQLFGKGYKLEQSLGVSVSTGYKSRLTKSITAGSATIDVSSVNDINGKALTCSASEPCYFNIEPGGMKQEPVLCTGVTGSQFTGCSRGLLATGVTPTASSTLAYAHNAGSQIIMTNISQFYGNFVDTNTNQSVGGIKTFTSFPLIATSTSLPTTDGQFATKRYVDQVGAGGFTAANASTTAGLEVFGTSPETVGVKASSTGGVGIDVTSGLYVKASSTGGIKSDATGVYVDGTQNFFFSGAVSSSKTPTSTTELITKGYADKGSRISYATTTNTALSGTTADATIASTTIAANAIGSNGLVKVKANFTGFTTNNSKTYNFRLKFGGTTVATAAFTTVAANSAGTITGTIEAYVYAANSTSAQEGTLTVMVGNGIIDASTNNTSGFTSFQSANGTSAVNTTSNQDVVITAQETTAGMTITVNNFFVEVINN